MLLSDVPEPTGPFFEYSRPPEGWLRTEIDGGGHFTLVFILAADGSRNQILLGRKKRGFGRGKFNGFGGKLEVGETLSQCAVREVKEECGLVVDETALEERGEIAIVRATVSSTVVAIIHLYTVSQWTGVLVETDEMSPAWYDLSSLPWSKMWPEASIYLPSLLEPNNRSRLLSGRVDYRDDEAPCGWWFRWD